jgi:hypothetical protein
MLVGRIGAIAKHKHHHKHRQHANTSYVRVHSGPKSTLAIRMKRSIVGIPANNSPLQKKCCDAYYIIAIAATVLHFLNVVGMLAIYWGGFDGETTRDSCFQTTVSYLKWKQIAEGADTEGMVTFNTSSGLYGVKHGTVAGNKLRLHWLIVAFHALSFLFQGVVLIPGWYRYENRVKEGSNPMRFIEYSISASIMLVSVALISGIIDENELITISVLCGATQMCGLVSETIVSNVEKLKNEVRGDIRCIVHNLHLAATVAHLSGWVMVMVGYGVIWRYFILSASESDSSPPEFVVAIVSMLFLMFNSFGVVQLVQMSKYVWCSRCCRCTDDNEKFNSAIELAYTVLSLVAKTLLGWMMYANVLAMAQKC